LLSSASAILTRYLPGLGFGVVLADHMAMWWVHWQGAQHAWVLLATGAALTLVLGIEWIWCLWDLARAGKREK
jgi:hypothetical protein